MMKPVCLVLIFVLFASSTFARKEVNDVGGWKPIDITDPHVIEIANFAVTEHDRQSGETLKLEKVIKADTQIVTGINYRLTLAAAAAGSSSRNYQAIVLERVWNHFKNLTSFIPVQA